MSGWSDFSFEKVGGSSPLRRALRTLYSTKRLMALDWYSYARESPERYEDTNGHTMIG